MRVGSRGGTGEQVFIYEAAPGWTQSRALIMDDHVNPRGWKEDRAEDANGGGETSE